MRRRLIAILGCSVLLVAVSRAEEQAPAGPPPLSLTMQRAIAFGLEKNFSIRVESYSPLIAAQRTRIESGRFDPTLDVSYSRGEFPEGGASPGSTQEERFDAGLQGLLPWGMTYNLGTNSRNTQGTLGGTSETFDRNAQFGLRQPLLRDFGTGVTLSQLRIARASQRISEWQLRAQVIDVITQIYFVYNELYFQMENLLVARRSQAFARQLYEDNRRRAEIGTMSPLDITQARAEVASREEAVILSERAVRDNENFLKQLITDHVENLLRVRVSIAPPPTAAPFPLDVEAGIRDALTWRPDYRQALLDLEKRKITVTFERNQALPRLDLTGSLNLLGFDRDFINDFNGALSRDKTSWSAGAIFSLPIPNRQGRGRATAAQLSAAQGLLDLKRLEQEIVVRVDNAAGQIVTARQRIRATAEASRLARESLDAGQQRLSAGTGTTFEVLGLQRQLAEAEAAELRARADHNKAVSEYDRQTGVAIERNGLSLER